MKLFNISFHFPLQYYHILFLWRESIIRCNVMNCKKNFIITMANYLIWTELSIFIQLSILMNDSNSNESRWKWFESVCKPKKQEVYFNAPRYETRLIFTYPRGTRSQIDRSPPSSIEYTRVLAVVSAHQIGTFHRGNKIDPLDRRATFSLWTPWSDALETGTATISCYFSFHTCRIFMASYRGIRVPAKFLIFHVPSRNSFVFLHNYFDILRFQLNNIIIKLKNFESKLLLSLRISTRYYSFFNILYIYTSKHLNKS